MASAITLSDALTSAVLASAATSAPASPVQAVGVPGTASSEAAQPLGATPTGPGANSSGGGSMLPLLLPFAVVMVLMFIFTSQSTKREKKRRDEIMKGLKRQDKVITGGGIIGTVVEMNDDEVVLRVEEGKIRVSKASIGQVLREAKAGSVAEVKADNKPVNV